MGEKLNFLKEVIYPYESWKDFWKGVLITLAIIETVKIVDIIISWFAWWI